MGPAVPIVMKRIESWDRQPPQTLNGRHIETWTAYVTRRGDTFSAVIDPDGLRLAVDPLDKQWPS